MKGFTTKRARQKRNSDFSFANERKEQTRLCGFTLIETMVAVSILAIAVAGPLVTASRAMVAAQTARDQLIASHLAQEGVEYVRALRDNAYLVRYQEGEANASYNAWQDFLYGPEPTSLNNCIYDNSTFPGAATTPGSVVCTLDPTFPIGVGTGYALQPCTPDPLTFPLPACTKLYLNGTTNFYTQQSTGAVETPFKRTIQINRISPVTENVIVTVTWTFHGQGQTVEARTGLSPWQ